MEEADELRDRLRAAESSTVLPRLQSGAASGASHKPLAIVIPMIGLGNSFLEAGYSRPRPLVNIAGRPLILWILDHLTLHPDDVVFLVVPDSIERRFGLSKLVAVDRPGLQLQTVTLPFETRGWIETVFSVVRQMSSRELRMPLVTLDCSTIYYGADVLAEVRTIPEGAGASCCFAIESAESLMARGSTASQFSYVKTDEQGCISSIAEKHVISDMANTGAYIFRDGRCFRAAAETYLESPECGKGGLYASSLIAAMLRHEHRFMTIQLQCKQFEILSTPAQVQAFAHRVSSGSVKMERTMRFCFDLDGTLVSEPKVPEDWSSCQPNDKAIALARQLHEAGHTIIVVTSRGMRSGRGMAAAMAEIGQVTFSTLSKFEIPFDELHFGKPHADVYIDSRTLSSCGDVERELGWRVSSPASDGHEALDGAIDARAFNVVRAKGKAHVIKSSTPDVLRGECHWYKSIPDCLSGFFPTPVEIFEGALAGAGVGLSSITMERVNGITYSHLLTSRLLMRSHLRKLVEALHQIHSYSPSEASGEGASDTHVTVQEMCSNYSSKVSKRMAKHGELYASLGTELGIDTGKMSQVIVEFLDEFEANERPKHAHFIHGDPVFSNVLFTEAESLILIDMRGELGARLTTQGDVHYDLSKVYQSLCGYDFMLLDRGLDEGSSEMIDGLRATFWEQVAERYPDISHRNIRLHTAAHFFAIVPLHEVKSRMARFLRTSFSMLSVEGLM